MDVSFGTFNVIMKVIPQSVDKIDRIVSGSRTCMTWKENKCNISNVVPDFRICVLQLHWRPTMKIISKSNCSISSANAASGSESKF